ncbi:hypothetical protein GCM10027212_19690 [Actinotalea caeni]
MGWWRVISSESVTHEETHGRAGHDAASGVIPATAPPRAQPRRLLHSAMNPEAVAKSGETSVCCQER